MGLNRTAADVAIGVVIDAAIALGHAKQREMELGAVRPLIKSDAIARIMAMPDPQKDGKLYAATAAEKLVETDLEYKDHLARERAATAATIEAMGRYEAAKLRARLECAGAEIEGLEAVRLGLSEALTVVAR